MNIGDLTPDGDDWIARKLRDLEQQLAELRGARTLEASAIGEGGLVVKGGAITLEDLAGAVLAKLDASGVTVDGTLKVTGHAEIDGTLSLPAGIIDNDALASPVSGATFTGSKALSLTFTGAWATYVTKTMTVPSGFTKAIVFATAVATAISGGSTTSALQCRAVINGNAGGECDALMTQGAVSVGTHSIQLTGLSGGDTITVQAQAADGSSPTNLLAGTGGCSLSGWALFLR